MSLLDREECARCFGLKGWAGDRARRNPLRQHLACTCSIFAGLVPDADRLSDPFRRVA
jgi:hypothetical protein